MDFRSKFDPITKIWHGADIPHPAPLDMFIGEMILDFLQKYPKRVVQICQNEGELIAEDFRLQIIRMAQNLVKLGIKEGDVIGVVCLYSKNLISFVNGIIQIGAIVNPISAGHDRNDLVNMFRQTIPKLVICDADIYERVKDAMSDVKNDSPIYTANGRLDGILCADDLLEPTGSEASFQTPKIQDPSNKTIAILSSSGSSGQCKAVRMSQTFFLKLAAISVGESRALNFSQIFWGSGFSSVIIAALSNETRITTTEPFSPKLCFELAAKHKATIIFVTSALLTQLLQSPLIKTFDKSNLKTILNLGGIASEPLRKRFLEEFPNVYFANFYGLTETSCSMIFPGQPIEGLTCGYVLPNHMMKICDENGKALGMGEVGEIYAKYKITEFLGYYNNLEASKDAVDEQGFVKTGDIGYVSEDGNVFVIDRKKDIFKYRGIQINPTEIESVIQEIEGVKFVAVVGLPESTVYNLPAALIEKKPGFEGLTEKFIIDYVAKILPEYKQLHGGAYFTEKMPFTESGKLLRRKAKEIVIEMYEAMGNKLK